MLGVAQINVITNALNMAIEGLVINGMQFVAWQIMALLMLRKDKAITLLPLIYFPCKTLLQSSI